MLLTWSSRVPAQGRGRSAPHTCPRAGPEPLGWGRTAPISRSGARTAVLSRPGPGSGFSGAGDAERGCEQGHWEALAAGRGAPPRSSTKNSGSQSQAGAAKGTVLPPRGGEAWGGARRPPARAPPAPCTPTSAALHPARARLRAPPAHRGVAAAAAQGPTGHRPPGRRRFLPPGRAGPEVSGFSPDPARSSRPAASTRTRRAQAGNFAPPAPPPPAPSPRRCPSRSSRPFLRVRPPPAAPLPFLPQTGLGGGSLSHPYLSARPPGRPQTPEAPAFPGPSLRPSVPLPLLGRPLSIPLGITPRLSGSSGRLRAAPSPPPVSPGLLASSLLTFHSSGHSVSVCLVPGMSRPGSITGAAAKPAGGDPQPLGVTGWMFTSLLPRLSEPKARCAPAALPGRRTERSPLRGFLSPLLRFLCSQLTQRTRSASEQ